MPTEPFMEGWTVLSALAAVTSRIRLATLASSVAHRNPAHLAKIAAGVDRISRVRMTLGIGAGWFEGECKQYDQELPTRPATRIRQMEEAIQLILQMWTEPRTTLHSRYCHVEEAISRAQAGAETTPARNDRRRRRAADLTRGRPPRRCLQCRR
jgi:alkanesulfonate monooxygenase SsuD/methylene tetrahydromethanopterin reductase-like flavin-dependent oxidoreductase (luciferase family)